MKLHALDIPENPSEVARWLERHLTGLELGELAAELKAIHGDAPGTAADLDQLLGPQREALLSGGLSKLSTQQIQQLLQQPKLLVELQELVLVEGGSYWQQLADSSTASQAAFDRGLSGFNRTLERKSSANNPRAQIVQLPPTQLKWYQRSALASLATAAALILGFFLLSDRPRVDTQTAPPQVAATGWGWSSTDALPTNLDASAYLEKLADGAKAWFNKRPESREDVARRLLELRQGCSTLILAEHKPLSERDREWLLERCFRWAARFDAQLTALEHGQDPLEVRAEVDETVERIIETLRSRADRGTA